MVPPRWARDLGSMSRRYRPYLPGGTFHLATRLQAREALFTPRLRTRLVALLRETVAVSDVELFAYVIMPNHVHLVVRQGAAPLSRFMQPWLRRAALLIHKSYGREGHVLERRYRDRPCRDPDHLRNTIIYAHLNPVRAGLCVEPGEYPWSSFAHWVGSGSAADGLPHPTSLVRVSQVFAQGDERTRSQLRQDYIAFQEWRRAHDRLQTVHPTQPAPCPPEPTVTFADANWLHYLARQNEGKGVPRSNHQGERAGSRPDLATIARAVIADAPPGLSANQVRSRWGGRSYVAARRAIIRRADAAGFQGSEIAAYLRISTSAVSAVLTATRKRLLRT